MVGNGEKYQRVITQTSPIANGALTSTMSMVHNTQYAIKVAQTKTFQNANCIQKTV